MSQKKKIIIIGATGSIGVNSLNCVENLPDYFNVVGLSTHVNVPLLMKQARQYHPDLVAVTGKELTDNEKRDFRELNIPVFTGPEALIKLVQEGEFDLLVNAVVGAAGFLPTLAALERGKNIALANKETLVVGGELVMAKVREKKAMLLPIDSEHSAIFQSLMGENYNDIEHIFLTASGGPFRKLPKEEFKTVTVDQALKHPNWTMGQKITIDSATMMNKGLEVIEAHWLFNVDVDKVRVVIHPQSIIHSLVSFCDGSVKAQLGVPDMRTAIQLAMTYPKRRPSPFPRLDFTTVQELTFDVPDFEKFRCLFLAYQAARTGGTAPAVMNAANEIAVKKFLQQQIRFDRIPIVIEQTLNAHNVDHNPTVDQILQADKWARSFTATNSALIK